MAENRVVLVTGGCAGIGLAIVRAFLAEGAWVVVNDVSQDRLEAVYGGEDHCIPIAGDIAEADTARRMKETALKRFGRIDVVVNNAGINMRVPFLQLAEQDWRRMMDINLNGCFHVLRQTLPCMAQRRQGCVVNVSSSAAKTPHPTAAASYAASKGGINALTRQLALEMAPYGVRVNAVCPGAVETEMTRQWSEEYRQKKLASIPLGRLGSPREVAALVTFLASDQAGYITGETVNINGGSYMD